MEGHQASLGRLDKLASKTVLVLASLGLGLLGTWASASWGQALAQNESPTSLPTPGLGSAAADASPPTPQTDPPLSPNDTAGHSVIELPRGWLPQRRVQAQIPWWQVGLNLSNQLITPISNGGGAPFNSVTALDLTTTLGSGLGRRQPRGEMDRWSLNLQLTNFSASGNFGVEAGLVSSQVYPQSLFQSPSGLWLQGLWLQRNGQAHERLAQLKFGDLSLGNDFLHGAATNLYVNGLINGHNGISVPGVPYGPLNALGAIATIRLGPLDNPKQPVRTSLFGGSLRLGLFQLNSGRSNSQFRGFNQSVSSDDGLLELIEWQLPLAQHLSHCDQGKQESVRSERQGPGPSQKGVFVAPSGCQSSRLLQNQLPEPMLQITFYNANWAFTSVNGPALQGMATNGQAAAGRQAQGVAAYLAVPTPLPLAFASRVWISASLSGQPQINPYPGYLAGGWIGQGLIPSRPTDLLILGVAGSSTSQDLQPSQPSQAILELSYQLQLNSKLSLQPYSQLQSGTPGQGPLWTVGMQWSWSL